MQDERPEDVGRPARTRRRGPSSWPAATRVAGLAAALALLIGACTGSPKTAPPTPAETSGTPSGSGGPATGGIGSAIPQPVLPPDIPVAPVGQRVDLRVPRFSNPTHVTNPLFPVSLQSSVLFVGHVEGKPFRTEVTLLPYTRVIAWGGQLIETLVSQYAAYLGGRLQEVAYDLYAQADDGSVWYFGEDVVDLANGDVVTKEGTWVAPKDGPAQMIMPGDPKVGDVYRTENIPGIAFEQVTVRSVGVTFDGPFGPITGGMIGEELHMDGAKEGKQFAPGYGEYYTADGPDVEALALAVPTDAASEPLPSAVSTLRSEADAVLADLTARPDWKRISEDVRRVRAAWAGVPSSAVPRLIGPWMDRAVEALATGAAAHDRRWAAGAAVTVLQSAIDMQLRYRPRTEIDLARFDLWAARVQLDAAVDDPKAVNGDVFSLFYIRDRILGILSPADRPKVDIEVDNLQVAGQEGDLVAATAAANRLRTVIERIMANG